MPPSVSRGRSLNSRPFFPGQPFHGRRNPAREFRVGPSLSAIFRVDFQKIATGFTAAKSKSPSSSSTLAASVPSMLSSSSFRFLSRIFFERRRLQSSQSKADAGSLASELKSLPALRARRGRPPSSKETSFGKSSPVFESPLLTPARRSSRP